MILHCWISNIYRSLSDTILIYWASLIKSSSFCCYIYINYITLEIYDCLYCQLLQPVLDNVFSHIHVIFRNLLFSWIFNRCLYTTGQWWRQKWWSGCGCVQRGKLVYPFPIFGWRTATLSYVTFLFPTVGSSHSKGQPVSLSTWEWTR